MLLHGDNNKYIGWFGVIGSTTYLGVYVYQPIGLSEQHINIPPKLLGRIYATAWKNGDNFQLDNS